MDMVSEFEVTYLGRTTLLLNQGGKIESVNVGRVTSFDSVTLREVLNKFQNNI
jgi:hypothetical protein